MKLWHAFVQNVDPIVKILHIPTAEVEIFTAINQPGSVSKDTLALLYAIYFAAATSLEPDDISKMLDMTQLAALGKFRTHFQKALADTDALENPTVPLLQGLAIYLVCLVRSVSAFSDRSVAYCSKLEFESSIMDPEWVGASDGPDHWLTH